MFLLIAIKLVPAPLHRALLRVAHRGRRLWWRWRRPSLEACRIIAVDEAGRVLLVRHSYGHRGWMPPGGGMKRGENPLRAASRELSEEAGCPLVEAQVVEVIHDRFHGAESRLHVVLGTCLGEPRPDGREIIAAEFFALDALPEDMLRGLDEALPRWIRTIPTDL